MEKCKERGNQSRERANKKITKHEEMSRIGRSDLAKALLDEVESTTNIRAGIAVTSLPKNTKKVIPVKGLESHD